MGEEGKKISFGFSKLKKPTNLIKPVVEEKKEIEYVDAFDGAKGKFSYKGSVREEPVKKDLVIPLLGTKTALEVIKARLEERQKAEEERDPKPENGDVQVKTEPVEVEANQLSIEELAAREIMTEAQGGYIGEETTNGLVISQNEKKPNFEGKVEATLEDYENVPVVEYGLAMLRGMGWKPDKKKDPKDEVELPTPRPKGLGLGAERVLAKPTQADEDLTIGVKSYVKFISGSNNGRYAQVESVDGDTNRVVVKLALGGTVSVSEVIITPVTKKDYEKNSKIINSVKYEQYKELSDKKLESARDEKISHRKEKYERSRERKHSSGSESDSKKYKKGSRHKSSRKNRDSDADSQSSEEEKERKHKKKNKKDKSRSNSRDRRHKKKKKKKYSSDSESPPRRSRDYESHKSKSRR